MLTFAVYLAIVSSLKERVEYILLDQITKYTDHVDWMLKIQKKTEVRECILFHLCFSLLAGILATLNPVWCIVELHKALTSVNLFVHSM